MDTRSNIYDISFMNKDTRSQSDTFRHCCDRQSKDKRSYIYEVSLMSKDTRSQGDTFYTVVTFNHTKVTHLFNGKSCKVTRLQLYVLL